jgi:hypothetical protein
LLNQFGATKHDPQPLAARRGRRIFLASVDQVASAIQYQLSLIVDDFEPRSMYIASGHNLAIKNVGRIEKLPAAEDDDGRR